MSPRGNFRASSRHIIVFRRRPGHLQLGNTRFELPPLVYAPLSAMAPSDKHPITTHVLDQTTGLPAKNLRATLTLFNAHKELVGTWEATTSATDGRISAWPREDPQLPEVLEALGANGDPVFGNLLFHTGEYWGAGKTFYPEIVVTFVVDPKDERKHWHVPVLMGPFGYTTYRGS